MILTDREWLRFVTWGILAGAVFGAVYTGGLFALGNTLTWSMSGAVIATGVLAALLHVVLRLLIDRVTAPAPADGDGETA